MKYKSESDDMIALRINPPFCLRVGMEFIGTFMVCILLYTLYTCVGSLFYTQNWIHVIATGLVYGCVIAMFSKFADVHLNPAITFATALLSRLKIWQALSYIAAQVLGAITSGYLLPFFLPRMRVDYGKSLIHITANSLPHHNSNLLQFESSSSGDVHFQLIMTVLLEILLSASIVALALNTMRSGAYGETMVGFNGVGGAAGDADGGNASNARLSKTSEADGSMLTHGNMWYVCSLTAIYTFGAALLYPLDSAGMNPARSTGIAFTSLIEVFEYSVFEDLWAFWVCPLAGAFIVALIVWGSRLFVKFAVSLNASLDEQSENAGQGASRHHRRKRRIQ